MAKYDECAVPDAGRPRPTVDPRPAARSGHFGRIAAIDASRGVVQLAVAQ